MAKKLSKSAQLYKMRRALRRDRGKAVRETTLLRGIKQGVGMVVKKPFGNGNGNGKSVKKRVIKAINKKAALCALNNIHLPLPRAVGAYTVCKTTTIVDSSQSVMIFGVFKGDRVNYSDPGWMNAVAVGSNTPGSAINSTNNAFFYLNDALASGGFSSAGLIPAAITLQVMCPTNLQGADGICYIGRAKQVLQLCGDTRSWTNLAEELVSFSAPRLCSAGKLALRGVKVDAIPYNMSQLANFCPRTLVSSGGYKTWNEGEFEADMEGFAPLFCYNKNNCALQYLLTIEWRTRFDPANPAYAGHSYHPVASDAAWNDIVHSMEQEGNGVVDMAEGVADLGEAAGAALGGIL